MYSSNIEKLKGQTPVEISGMREGSEEVVIGTKEGNTLLLRYEPDCCATCEIYQVDGDPIDLLGAPLLMCEQVTGESLGFIDDQTEDSHTWTFVKFGTIHGYVTLRWYGRSNGYYSEAPTAYYIDKDEPGYHRWRG